MVPLDLVLIMFLSAQALCLGMVGLRAFVGLLFRKGVPSGVARAPRFARAMLIAQAGLFAGSVAVWFGWDSLDALWIGGPGWEPAGWEAITWRTLACLSIHMGGLSLWYFLYRWGLVHEEEVSAGGSSPVRERWAAAVLLTAVVLLPYPAAVGHRILYWSHPEGTLGTVSNAIAVAVLVLLLLGLVAGPFKKANSLVGWWSRWLCYSIFCLFLLSTAGVLVIERVEIERARAYCNRVNAALEAFQGAHNRPPNCLEEVMEGPAWPPPLVAEHWDGPPTKGPLPAVRQAEFLGTLSPVERYWLDEKRQTWQRDILSMWY